MNRKIEIKLEKNYEYFGDDESSDIEDSDFELSENADLSETTISSESDNDSVYSDIELSD